ncbi:MAG: hypothetical protein IPO69_08380 [Saprospiraceae bacterium]|nr:hypothetical protein [Saprospiraceae bacterium]
MLIEKKKYFYRFINIFLVRSFDGAVHPESLPRSENVGSRKGDRVGDELLII